MDRRGFIKGCSVLVTGSIISNKLGNKLIKTGETMNLPDDEIKRLADIANTTAKANGASYSDFRLTSFRDQYIQSREKNIEYINESDNSGFAVRVLVNGVWGFASSSTFSEKEVKKISELSCIIAKANSVLQKHPVVLAPVSVYNDTWKTSIKKDSFEVSLTDKVNLLLSINDKALSLGVDYCSSSLWSVKEEKYFASSVGSYIKQEMYRIYPEFEITMIDKNKGHFEERTSLTTPIGKGYEYVEEYDFMSDMELAVEETKQKLNAPSVVPGKKDIILDPTNLWLTIHESCGHPTELDRALGFEANYAGTSFMTTDKLGKLYYGSEHVNLTADRTQKDGLATRGYDDDGVKTVRWPIIKNGLFVGYQTTREMAGYINEKESNACAYADSWSHFPIQRMPNVSLEPGAKKLSLNDLIADTEDGIYIVGRGSWSIDMQRYNFQFTGQAFHEIKNGKITGILRDVAYQGNTVDFWNSCDAVCDESEYRLGGSMFCGKGEPGQISPVSHGASPARFRNVNILNTSNENK